MLQSPVVRLQTWLRGDPLTGKGISREQLNVKENGPCQANESCLSLILTNVASTGSDLCFSHAAMTQWLYSVIGFVRLFLFVKVEFKVWIRTCIDVQYK